MKIHDVMLGVALLLASVWPASASHNTTLCLPDGATALLSTDSGLHLWARLEEASGTRADSSAMANHLSPVNNPSNSSDHQEGDYSLDLTETSSQYLERTSASLDAGFPGRTGGANTALTIAGWVKTKSSGHHPLIIKADGTQRSFTVWVWNFGAGPVIDPNIFSASGGSYTDRGVADFQGTTVLQVNQWYHFAYTYDGTTGMSRLYVNGTLEAGPFYENMTTYFTGTAPFRLGYRPGFGSGSTYADVRLDEVLVLDRVLSATEVASLYDNGVVSPTVFCNDGNVCNGVETCNPLTGCQAGNPLLCNDGNVCTDDDCNPSSGCVTTNNTAPCDDGLFCTGTDTCSGGTCQHTGDPCTGGTECADACDEAADGCFDPAGTACTPDGNVCTDDVCDGAGGCGVNNTAPCDDGLFCTGTETCGGGTCQQSGDPCTGGTECADACDEAGNGCFDPAGTACTPDGNVCTDDVCDGAGGCGVNNTAPCEDGQFCNGSEACAGGICNAGTSPCVGLCDEGDDACIGNCPLAPQTCRAAERSLLVIEDPSNDPKDRLLWKWAKGDATSKAEFGDPTGDAEYSLCLYAGMASVLIAEALVPAGTGWQAQSKGYRYNVPSGGVSGIHRILLKGGTQNKSKALVKGEGSNLPDLALPIPLPEPVTAQLLNSATGICWGSAFSDDQVIKNDDGEFKGKVQD